MVQLWQIVGGADKGGIMVREGEALSSTRLEARLSTNAIVEELLLTGERLNYKLREGSGPDTGWISTKLPGKDLAVRLDSDPAKDTSAKDTPPKVDVMALLQAPAEATQAGGPLDPQQPNELRWPRPSGLPPIVSEDAPAMRLVKDMTDEEFEALPKRTWPHPNYTRKQHPEMAKKDVPGKRFGLVFPYSIETIRAAGPEFLTRAFHVANTLPKSNRVMSLEVIPLSVDPMEGEAVGGSSIKALLVVSYEREVLGLHKRLFCKLPLEPTPDSERVYNGKNWFLDEPEGMFSLVAQACPFRSPKCYFWDYSPESTNFIHIWECYEFSKDYKPSEPWVLCKPGLKARDYELPNDGLERYIAFMRALARFVVAFQTDALGDRRRLQHLFDNVDHVIKVSESDFDPLWMWPTTEEQREIKEQSLQHPDFQKYVEGRTYQNKAMGELMLASGIDLVLNVAPQLFEGQHTDRGFLQRFFEEALHVQTYKAEILEYLAQLPELWSLFHPNTQLDNAVYFYTDADCTQMDCSVIDWGSTTGLPYLQVLANNLLSGTEPRMLIAHFDDIVGAFVSAYHEAGGSPRVEQKLVSECIKVGMCDGVSGLLGFTRILMNNFPPSDPRWRQFKDRWDPEIVDHYMRRATIFQLHHVFGTWSSSKLNLYGTFKQWLTKNTKILMKREKPKPTLPKPPTARAKAKPKA